MLFTAGGTRPAPAGEELAEDPTTEVEHEFKLEQAEIASDPSTDLDVISRRSRRRRAELIESAACARRHGWPRSAPVRSCVADGHAGRALPAHARAVRPGRRRPADVRRARARRRGLARGGDRGHRRHARVAGGADRAQREFAVLVREATRATRATAASPGDAGRRPGRRHASATSRPTTGSWPISSPPARPSTRR